jgi:mRNA interferase MazF
MEGLLEIEEVAWTRGGTPEKSHIVPWGVQSVGSVDIDYWQGRIKPRLAAEAVDALVE